MYQRSGLAFEKAVKRDSRGMERSIDGKTEKLPGEVLKLRYELRKIGCSSQWASESTNLLLQKEGVRNEAFRLKDLHNVSE